MEIIGIIKVPSTALQAAPKRVQLRHRFPKAKRQRPCILNTVSKPCIQHILHFLNYILIYELSSTLTLDDHPRVPLDPGTVLVMNAFINRNTIQQWPLVKLCVMSPGRCLKKNLRKCHQLEGSFDVKPSHGSLSYFHCYTVIFGTLSQSWTTSTLPTFLADNGGALPKQSRDRNRYGRYQGVAWLPQYDHIARRLRPSNAHCSDHSSVVAMETA